MPGNRSAGEPPPRRLPSALVPVLLVTVVALAACAGTPPAVRPPSSVPGPSSGGSSSTDLSLAAAEATGTATVASRRILVATISVGNRPEGVAAGCGGIWVANHADGSVSRIDPAANRVVAVVRVGRGPARLMCAFGSMWVLDDQDRRLWRVDPGTGRATGIRLGGRASGSPAVADGALWLTVWDGAALVRVDPATNRAQAVAGVAGAPTGVLFAQGSLWVASSRGGIGHVTRITPGSLRTEATILAGRLPWFQGTSAEDGAIWVADGYAGTVLRIDPATNQVVGLSRVGQLPVASVLPGTVWVNLTGTVSRIDTGTNEVVETIRLGGSPGGVAVGFGSVWVAGSNDATVWRLAGSLPP